MRKPKPVAILDIDEVDLWYADLVGEPATQGRVFSTARGIRSDHTNRTISYADLLGNLPKVHRDKEV
jgi:hypothetical protein